MLPLGQLGDYRIRLSAAPGTPNRTFDTYLMLDIRFGGHDPIVAASV